MLPSYSFYYIKAKIEEPITQARCKYYEGSLFLASIAKFQIHLKKQYLKLITFVEFTDVIMMHPKSAAMILTPL